jgi:HK97 family phage portal protein
MSLFTNRDLGDTSTQLTPPRTRSYGSTTISTDTAMRSSAVWACVRLRADLLSTLPIDTFRTVGGMDVKMPPTPFLLDPGGEGYGAPDWLYSSQTDLDRSGNAFGLILARDALGNPSVIELQPMNKVTVIGTGPKITRYRISGTAYDPRDVWHERQFTIPGVPMGLSPIAYAAMTIGTYLSAQQFGLDWFGNGSVPAGRLKNSQRTINSTEANIVKDRFKSAVASRDLFVHGADWEYDAISVNANESQFLATMEYGVQDIARFFGVPGDLIDAPALSTAKITYANITQRHLQFLIMNLGPTIIRRENALSSAIVKPRRVRFDTNAFLRLDPQTQAAVLNGQVLARTLAPSEARAVDNRLPYTDEQLAEFDRLFGKAQANPGMSTGVTP